MRPSTASLLVLASFAPCLAASPALAAWPTDPTVNVALCTAGGDQIFPAVVSDGAGGLIAAWMDGRDGNYDIYAQRVSADGHVAWKPDGVAICAAPNDQTSPSLVADGSGGAIVVWTDFRDGTNLKLYAQSVAADGSLRWAANGVPVCTAAGDQSHSTSGSDGSGGAILTWMDLRSGGYDIYAQRFSAAGTRQWADTGVVVCGAIGFQEEPSIMPDGSGGAIIAWYDQRTGSSFLDDDIYAQRIDAGGSVSWTPADGVALCTAAGTQQTPRLASDQSGGAIVTWFDGRNGNLDIYAQRVNATGSVTWTPGDGVAVCTAAQEQAYPAIISDQAGGAIVAWRDYRNGTDYDTYAQRVSDTGAPLWGTDGLLICDQPGDQYDPSLVPDATGGAVISWADLRGGVALDIYSQHVSPTGSIQWPQNGVALSTAPELQNPAVSVSDGAHGAIVVWHDQRNGGFDIYAQRVQGSGALGGDVAGVPRGGQEGWSLTLENPARSGRVRVRFSLPAKAPAMLELLDVQGRRISSRIVEGAGAQSLELRAERKLAPGLYVVRLTQGKLARTASVAVLD